MCSINPHDLASESWAKFVSSAILPVIKAHPDPVVIDTDLVILSEYTGLDLGALRRGSLKVQPLEPPALKSRPEFSPPETRMSNGRFLCAAVLQLPQSLPEASWTTQIPWTHIDIQLLTALQCITVIRIRATRLGCAVADAIRPDDPASHQLSYWASVPLPDVPTVDAIRFISSKLAEETKLKRIQQGVL